MIDFSIDEIGVPDLSLSVAECVAKVWEHRSLSPSPESKLAELQQFWPAQKDSLLLVARAADGGILGFRFTHALPDEKGERVCWDQNGGVHPDCRRQGIGRALLREQHRIAKDRGYARIRTGTALPLTPMIILNLQEGFEITGLDDVKGDGWTARCLMFEKRL